MSSQTRDITVALVGCGAAAEQFYIPVLAAQAGNGVKSILVDLDLDRAADLARPLDAEVAESISAAAEMGATGAILATPHHLHHGQAIEAIGLGLDLLIEKPVTVTAADAVDIHREAEHHGRVVMVNNNRRLFPSYRRIAAELAKGRIGEVKSVVVEDGSPFEWPTKSGFYITSKDAKGVLLDRGAHTIDILNWWLGGESEVVDCQHDGFEGAEALVRVALRGPGGSDIRLRFSRLAKLDNSFHIVGTDGEIRGRLFSWNKYEEKIETGDWHEVTADAKAPTNYEAFVAQMTEQFLAVVAEGAIPDVTISDVIPSIRVLEDAYNKARLFDLPWYAEWKRPND